MSKTLTLDAEVTAVGDNYCEVSWENDSPFETKPGHRNFDIRDLDEIGAAHKGARVNIVFTVEPNGDFIWEFQNHPELSESMKAYYKEVLARPIRERHRDPIPE